MRLAFIGQALALIVAVASLSFISWEVFINPWRAAYQSLATLTCAKGQLKSATIQRSTGKGHKYFLAFTLMGHPQEFGIWSDHSEQSLSILLSQLQDGQAVVVYYEPAWEMPGLGSQTNSDVYQLESAGRVIYGLAEVRQRYLNQGGWGLVFLCVVGLPILGFYWRHRANY